MDIRRKLQVFSLVTVLSMGAGVLVCATGLRAAMKAEDASHERERTLQGITEIKASALSTIQLDPSTDDTRKIFADAERNIGKWSSTLAASLAGTPHAAPFRALIAQWGDYDRRSHALFDLAARDAKAATDRTTALYHTDFEPFQHALEQMAGEMNALAEQQNAEARGVVDSVFVTVLSVMLGGMVVVCAMIFALARSLNRGIAALQTAIERIGGSRDFTLRAPVRGRDELARTAEAFNALIERVAAALREVWAASESASTATREIAAGNADLSARTETQAASLEESAASMAQLTATVSQNAENAKVASELAGNASGVAHTARGVVEAMVATMAEIGRHSSRIGEITALIDASVATVGTGESQAEQVRRTMAELQQGAGKVADVVDDISAASVEQSRGIAQVGQAVGHMDEVTQRNAALVEELAAASQAMARQMQALRDAVGIFRIGGPPAQRREPGDPGCAAGALGGRAALTPAFA